MNKYVCPHEISNFSGMPLDFSRYMTFSFALLGGFPFLLNFENYASSQY